MNHSRLLKGVMIGLALQLTAVNVYANAGGINVGGTGRSMSLSYHWCNQNKSILSTAAFEAKAIVEGRQDYAFANQKIYQGLQDALISSSQNAANGSQVISPFSVRYLQRAMDMINAIRELANRRDIIDNESVVTRQVSTTSPVQGVNPAQQNVNPVQVIPEDEAQFVQERESFIYDFSTKIMDFLNTKPFLLDQYIYENFTNHSGSCGGCSGQRIPVMNGSVSQIEIYEREYQSYVMSQFEWLQSIFIDELRNTTNGNYIFNIKYAIKGLQNADRVYLTLIKLTAGYVIQDIDANSVPSSGSLLACNQNSIKGLQKNITDYELNPETSIFTGDSNAVQLVSHRIKEILGALKVRCQ